MYSIRKNIVTTLFLSIFCIAGAHAANPAYAAAMRGEDPRGQGGQFNRQGDYEHRGHYAQENRYNEASRYNEDRREVQGEWQPKEYEMGQPAAPVIVVPDGQSDNNSSY